MKPRPIYERDEDRRREREAMNKLIAHLDASGDAYDGNEAPRLYPFDYEVLREGKPWAIVEIKCRTNTMMFYSNYMISMEKMRVLREEARIRNVEPLLMVCWSDAIGYANADEAAARGIKAYGGRYDRNDPMDHEAVMHIPLSVFKVFWKDGLPV